MPYNFDYLLVKQIIICNSMKTCHIKDYENIPKQPYR